MSDTPRGRGAQQEPLWRELDSPTDDWIELVRRAERARPGGRLGPYEILAELGRGGQGLVFRARQPATGREIALKRLAGGALSSPASRRRFEREVELAASLTHPGIVTVLGVEEVEGAALLAMEWVDGKPLTEWVATRPPGRAGLFSKLELVLQVCAAVEYAHGRGVIHRDLKPSNILVDASGRCRLLDFGLARRLELEDETTRTLGFVGTPAYAAPEHFTEGRTPLDVRSDVYSLGVVLYECLTGVRPFRSPRLPELMREIAEREPARPSSLAPGLDGELDAVVLKACAKRPEERYATAHALAQDLRRYLEGRSVLAVPPRPTYLVRKWIGRNRLAAGTLAALALSLVLFAGVGFRQAAAIGVQRDNAERALGQARHQAEMAFAVQDFYLEAISNSVQGAGGRDVADIVHFADEHLRERFRDYPDVAANLLQGLARLYLWLEEVDRTKELALEGLALLEQVPEPDLVTRAALEHTLGDVSAFHGNIPAALDKFRASAEFYRAYVERLTRGESGGLASREFRPMDLSTAQDTYILVLGSVAAAEMLLGLEEEALRDYAEAERVAEEAGMSKLVLGIVRMRALLLVRRHELDAAEGPLRAALARVESEAPDEAFEIGMARCTLASIRAKRGDTAEALQLQEDGLALMRRAFPAGHRFLWPHIHDLGSYLSATGRHDAALALFDEVLAVAQDPSLLARARAGRALSLRALERFEAAADAFADALPHLRNARDADSLRTQATLAAFSTFIQLERFEEAEALFPSLVGELRDAARRGDFPTTAMLDELRSGVAWIGYEAELEEVLGD